MARDLKVIGIKGDASFDTLVEHFLSLGGDAVIMDPMFVCGKDHIISAVEHAKRAFENGTNRSKTVLTEILIYAAGERQISKALSKMRPKPGVKEYAVAVLDIEGDLGLESIGMERDDTILLGTPEKAEAIGLRAVKDVPYEDLVLEEVAYMDVIKM